MNNVNNNERLVGKSDEIFLTQYAFDLKLEELKTASNPDNKELKITVHVYSNDPKTIVAEAQKIYGTARQAFRSNSK